jgi:CBS domain-containing protein
MRERETVRSVMTGQPVTVGRDAPFKEIAELLAARAISAVPVIDDDGVPVGVVSEADLLARAEHQDQDGAPSWLAGPRTRREWEKAQALRAAELMSPRPIVVGPDTPLPAAARELARAGVRRLLVVDGAGRLVGVLSRRDLLRPFLRDDAQLAAAVREQVLWRSLWLEPSDLAVSVQNGVVTLAGTVQRRSTAEIAVRLTNAVPGVVGVQDELHYGWDDVEAELGTSNLLH